MGKALGPSPSNSPLEKLISDEAVTGAEDIRLLLLLLPPNGIGENRIGPFLQHKRLRNYRGGQRSGGKINLLGSAAVGH
jgi:hypothetical protein